MPFRKFKAQKPPTYKERSHRKRDDKYQFTKNVNRIYFL